MNRVTELPRQRKVPVETIVEMGRLKGLSDGVVAFALTVLVLDIKVPADIEGRDLAGQLISLAPVFAVYLFSFVVIGGAWGAHQRVLGQMERGDGLMVWWTLLSLLPITLVPAAAGLLGDRPGEPLAMAVFATDVIAIHAAAWFLWRHASRQGLIAADIDPRVVSSIGRRHVFAAVCFAVSIPLAYVFVPISYAIWVATFALIFTTDWLSWQQARRATTASVPLEDAKRARIRLQHGTGSLDVQATEREAALAEGTFGGGTTSNVTRDGEVVDLTLALPRQSALLNPRYPWAWGIANLLDWDVALTTRIPIELSVDVSNVEANLHLEALQLAACSIRTSAGLIDIWLPDVVGVTTLHVQGDAASIVVHLPDRVGLSISSHISSSAIEDATGDHPVVVLGGEHRSPGYAAAARKVEIKAEIVAGVLQIVGPGCATTANEASRRPISPGTATAHELSSRRAPRSSPRRAGVRPGAGEPPPRRRA